MFVCFCFNDTATTEIYTLSLHDALPIYHHYDDNPLAAFFSGQGPGRVLMLVGGIVAIAAFAGWTSIVAGGFSGSGFSGPEDRKSTRLNSSHANISYAVFCLKKNNSLYPC